LQKVRHECCFVLDTELALGDPVRPVCPLHDEQVTLQDLRIGKGVTFEVSVAVVQDQAEAVQKLTC